MLNAHPYLATIFLAIHVLGVVYLLQQVELRGDWQAVNLDAPSRGCPKWARERRGDFRFLRPSLLNLPHHYATETHLKKFPLVPCQR